MRTEEEAIEVELDKINTQFREYDRQKANDKVKETPQKSSAERYGPS